MQIQIESFSDIIPYYAFQAYTVVIPNYKERLSKESGSSG